MFQLTVMQHIADLLEKNSKHLQDSSLTAEHAIFCVNALTARLDKLRDVSEFDSLLLKTDQLPDLELDEEKRLQKPSSRMKDFVAHSKAPITQQENSKDHHLRRVYFEAVDAVQQSFVARFKYSTEY